VAERLFSAAAETREKLEKQRVDYYRALSRGHKEALQRSLDVLAQVRPP
jgi:hypothetical protein